MSCAVFVTEFWDGCRLLETLAHNGSTVRSPTDNLCIKLFFKIYKVFPSMEKRLIAIIIFAILLAAIILLFVFKWGDLLAENMERVGEGIKNII
ncbi:MAG: hypothetical protein B6D64_10355 [Bacteroidetes bacterium 4484_276]|nr:MAG: hypothetical protein B6D64_10355 [Bacteroidetes bacterium 4484_276]